SPAAPGRRPRPSPLDPAAQVPAVVGTAVPLLVAVLRTAPGSAPRAPATAAALTGQRALHRLRQPGVERHALRRSRLLGLALDLLDQPQGDPADVAGVDPRAARRRWRRVGDMVRADDDPDVAAVQP